MKRSTLAGHVASIGDERVALVVDACLDHVAVGAIVAVPEQQPALDSIERKRNATHTYHTCPKIMIYSISVYSTKDACPYITIWTEISARE